MWYKTRAGGHLWHDPWLYTLQSIFNINWVASVAVQRHPAALHDPPPDFCHKSSLVYPVTGRYTSMSASIRSNSTMNIWLTKKGHHVNIANRPHQRA